MRTQTIRFTKGIQTLDDANASSPRLLRDALLTRLGHVEAVVAPRPYDGFEGLTSLPWTQAPWGEWFDRTRAFDGAEIAGRFYTSGRGPTLSSALLTMYGDGPDSGTSEGSGRTLLPLVLGVKHPPDSTVIADVNDGDVDDGVTGAAHVIYTLVPKDEYGQRGPARTFLYSGGAPFSHGLELAHEVLVSDPVVSLDVYRTREIFDTEVDGLYGSNADFTPYYLGTFGPEPGDLTRGGVVRFKDRNMWPGPDNELDADDPAQENVDPLGAVYDEPVSTFANRDNTIFYTGESDGDPYRYYSELLHPRGFHLQPFGGKLLMGNVIWPTKLPELVSFPRIYPDPYTSFDLEHRVQLEYATPDGPVYGPPLLLYGNEYALVKNNGEAAMKIWAKPLPGADWYYCGRAVPDATGYYRDTEAWIPPRLVGATLPDRQDFDDPPDGVDYISEPDTVQVSDVNRGWSTSFLGFSVPDGEEITGLAAARLAEAENIRAYDFYAFTKGHSYVVSGDDDVYIPQTLVAGVGCAEGRFDKVPVLCNTRQGVVFYGTDGRLYAVSGRVAQPIDVSVPGLWSEVYGLAFHSEEDRLCAVTDTGAWFYDVELQEWRGHLSGDFDFVAFDAVRRSFILRQHNGDVSGGGAVLWDDNPDTRALAESGQQGEVVRTAAVETQPVHTPGNVGVRRVKADYDPFVDSATVSATAGSPEATITDGDFFTEAHVGGPASLPGAGRQGSRLTTTLESVAGTTVQMASPARTSVGGLLSVALPALYEVRVSTGQYAGAASGSSDATTGGGGAVVVSQSFKCPPLRDRHPNVQGRSVVNRIEGFKRLRSLAIVLETAASGGPTGTDPD